MRLRLISDVPVGTFCSGGVDSSLVTALAAKLEGEPVNTFSVGFDEADFDESAFAKMVSEHHGTIHHELRVGNVKYAELFPRMVWHNDEPLDFANSVHIFALERARQAAGDRRADRRRLGRALRRLPALPHSGPGEVVPARARARAPRARSRWFTITGWRSWIGMPAVRRPRRCSTTPATCGPSVVREAYPRMNGYALAFRNDCLNGQEGLNLDSVGRVSLLDQETFLVSILHRQDKMSMAAAIESRVPFMDYRIVEFANRLPDGAQDPERDGQGDREGRGPKCPAGRGRRPPEVGVRRAACRAGSDRTKGLGAQIMALPDSPAADVFDRAVLRRGHRRAPAGRARPFRAALDGAQSGDLARRLRLLALSPRKMTRSSARPMAPRTVPSGPSERIKVESGQSGLRSHFSAIQVSDASEAGRRRPPRVLTNMRGLLACSGGRSGSPGRRRKEGMARARVRCCAPSAATTSSGTLWIGTC